MKFTQKKKADSQHYQETMIKEAECQEHNKWQTNTWLQYNQICESYYWSDYYDGSGKEN